MRRLLLTLVFLIPFIAFSSSSADTVITIDHLDQYGFTLKTGWKFINDDNPVFAKTDYDDRSWQSINPLLQVQQLPVSAQQGINWLRIKFRVSPAYRHSAAIRIYSTQATEIYLNGQLAGRSGTINNVLKTGRGYIEPTRPIELDLSNGEVQVLAARFANQPSLACFNRYLFSSPFFRVTFINTKQAENHIYLNQSIQFAILTGTSILSLLGLFHLTLLRYRNKNRANLYFACYAFCYALFLFIGIRSFYPHFADADILMSAASSFFFIISALFGVKALCVLFGFRPGWYFRILVIIAVLGLAGIIFIELFQNTLLNAIYVLVTGAELWLTLKAVWYKRRGALIVAGGFLTGLAGLIFYLYTFTHGYQPLPSIIAICMATLGPALGISLFLGREFALDSQLLALKLHEVEELSAANIAQEQEKLRILASQNETLEIKVAERTGELNQSLIDLKSTQTQLIQSEKMASLGELTAGIAHEIQNPLNFVNNFSEVNKELLGELKTEIDTGNFDEAKVIIADLIDNEEKIGHHGKRADSIVKSMLEHSRISSGQKELTDLNALADEYMRLSYHGLRAKDKSFNSAMETHFGSDLPKANVIPQDIGRVLLNLFNNAFYAVHQKKKQNPEGYLPQVILSTTTKDGFIEITVKDNGNGIPENIKDKIMQPFFTTKPTGEGTGLGLSLSYDIVVKGHRGSIDVQSKNNHGSVFTITLPLL
jgi:two-component system NtrC family sensor kinase